ncbi:MAG: tetratricopeptide repeat protein, partial [Candidatus Rokubacteria bacterium]|nr:tetratricopeptide repeat protein [Candidatus Rokubacteria bacterium]
LRQRHVELPDEKFEVYWKGKILFPVESAVKLPIPLLKAPEPREEEMPAPPFRPGPAWEIYNRLPVPSKYPMLAPGSPIVAEANLPTAAEVAELCKIEEPAGQGAVDQRDQRQRQFAVIVLKTGAKWEVARITDVLPDWVFYTEKGGARKRVSREQVKEVLSNNTNEEQYKIDSEGMQKYGPKEPDERVKLAQWCIAQGMIPEAKAELRKAIEARKDHLDAILLLGQVCFDTADVEGALAAYRAGLDHGASPGELWCEIGRCLRAVSFHEGALAAFEKSVEAQPRLHRGRIGLARAHLESGNAAAAIDAATDFFTKLGSAPDTTPAHRAEAHAVRGMAHFRGESHENSLVSPEGMTVECGPWRWANAR